MHTNIYTYIFMYVDMCVCVCLYFTCMHNLYFLIHYIGIANFVLREVVESFDDAVQFNGTVNYPDYEVQLLNKIEPV